MVAVTELDTSTMTQSSIAAALDEQATAIKAIRADQAEYNERLEAERAERNAQYEADVTERQEAARSLIRLRRRMEIDLGIEVEEVAALKGRRRTAAAASTSGTVERPNIVARKRNADIRRFAAKRGYEVPEKGADFSPELIIAYEQDGGYRG